MVPKTLVTLPTYNEIECLPRLVSEILAAAPQVDILVIDDSSPDGTGDWCDWRATTESRLHCLHRASKQGLGTATIAGMQFAIAAAYDLVINMDADFSHHPRYIAALVAAMQDSGADVMIGSRYVSGGRIEGWPLRRHVMSRALNWYARRLLRLHPRDTSGAFRCYRTAALAKIDFGRIRSRGYSFQEEILWHLERAGARVGEIPITFVDREHGTSKINTREALAAVRLILGLAVRGGHPRSAV